MNAAELESELDHEHTDSYVVFHLGAESYLVEVNRVREVLDAATITPVPGGAKALLGLYNLRGHIVPVWDPRIPFGLAAEPDALSARLPSVLVVEPDSTQPARVAGLRVDRVSDVLEIGREEHQPAPSLGLGGGANFIRGLVCHQNRFLLVLDMDRVFAAFSEGAERDDR